MNEAFYKRNDYIMTQKITHEQLLQQALIILITVLQSSA